MEKSKAHKHLINLAGLLVLMFVSSCASTKNVAYFKDISPEEQSALEAKAQFTEPIIQPDDILSIAIFTIDPASSTAINQLATQATFSGPSAPGQQLALNGILVDKNGEIELAMIGKIKLIGLTTFEARELIRCKAESYFKNPSVQVRYANFKVTILGEVTRPASYTLPNEKVTILDALGLAGDLTIFGKRGNVLVIRDNNGNKEFARLNLNSSEIFNSPYYYLRQNDVIYVEPTLARAAANNAARTQTIAIISSLIGVAVAILSRF